MKRSVLGNRKSHSMRLSCRLGIRIHMGAETEEGQLAAKILDEYMQDFQRRNPTLRVFSAHLHMDEATPHLHIDFVPYITGSKRGLGYKGVSETGIVSAWFQRRYENGDGIKSVGVG